MRATSTSPGRSASRARRSPTRCSRTARRCTGCSSPASARSGACGSARTSSRRLAGKEEDGRYQELRRRWAPHANRSFFVFFQAQAAFVVVFSLPFAFVAADQGEMTWLAWAGAALALVSIAGEMTADTQLAVWKGDPANKGKTARNGLWGWSRHPNYFFEWLHWVAWAVIAFSSPYGWVAIARARLPARAALQGDRDPRDGGAGATQPWRRLPALPGRGVRLRAAAAERRHGGDVIADRVVARGILPDPLLRGAIAQNCRLRLHRERRRGLDALEEMVAAMSDGADRDRDAARPTTSTTSFRPQFFALALGPRRKYSGCFWPDGVETLADAEETMLELTCARAGIVGRDGCARARLRLGLAVRLDRRAIPVVPRARSLQLGAAEGFIDGLGHPNSRS